MEKEKGITTLSALSIIIILIIIGGAIYFNTRPESEIMMNEGESMMQEGEEMMQEGEDMKSEGEAMMENGESMMEEDHSSAMEGDTPGTYEEYSEDKVMNAEGDIVLFFHATWCPTCKSLSSNIESNSANIPAGTTILKLDYDSNTELRKKYGVTTQHTLVQIDSNGNLISKWTGSPTLSSLVSQIK